MKIRAYKECNICSKVVATKYGFRYHTENFYVTLRSDDIAYEEATKREDIHICADCWMHTKYYVRSRIENEN